MCTSVLEYSISFTVYSPALCHLRQRRDFSFLCSFKISLLTPHLVADRFSFHLFIVPSLYHIWWFRLTTSRCVVVQPLHYLSVWWVFNKHSVCMQGVHHVNLTDGCENEVYQKRFLSISGNNFHGQIGIILLQFFENDHKHTTLIICSKSMQQRLHPNFFR